MSGELRVWEDQCPWWSGSRDLGEPPVNSFPLEKMSCKMSCRKQDLSVIKEWGYLSSSSEQEVGLETSPSPFQHELSHDPTPPGRNTEDYCVCSGQAGPGSFSDPVL